MDQSNSSDPSDGSDRPERAGLTALAAEMVLWAPGFCQWRKRVRAAKRLGLLSPDEARERTVVQTLSSTLLASRPDSDAYWVFVRSFCAVVPFSVAWSFGFIPALRAALETSDSLASPWLQAAMTLFGALTLSGDMGVSILLGGLLAFAVAASGTPLLVTALRSLFLGHRSEVRRACAESLGKLREARAIPSLAEAALSDGGRVGEAARGSMMTLLPELTEEHAMLLRENGTRLLVRHLRGASEEETVALLRAIEMAGDPLCLADLRRLVKVETRPGVRASFELTIAALEERLRRTREPQLLLRPVIGAKTPRERLVIPAANALREESALLVRPVLGRAR